MKWLLIFLSIFFTSCAVQQAKSDNLTVSFSSACGWCGGTDSMFFSDKEEFYEKHPICNFKGVKYQKAAITQHWDKISASMDWDRFRVISMNTCAVCADGCDDWVTVRMNGSSHTVRYSDIDHPELRSIKTFLSTLQSIREEYRATLPPVTR